MYVKNQYKNFLDSWIFCSLPVYKCGYYEDFIKCLGGGGETTLLYTSSTGTFSGCDGNPVLSRNFVES